MVDFNCCDHECACQHNGHLEAAQQYSSILSKVMSKNADSEYVSKEDKDKWNNKANQDVVDLIKMMVEKHEEKLDELEEGLDKKVKLILYDLGFGDNVLAKYATIEYVNELVAKIKNETSDLSKYALKTDLDTIKNDIQNKINNLTTEINNIKVTGGKDYSIESFNYTPSNGQLVLKQKNGGEFTVSIVAGGIDTSKLVTKEQLTNELTKYAEINKLKRLKVDGEVHTLYDTTGNGIIEITTSGGGGGGTGKDGGRYKAYFKCVDKGITNVDAPTTGSAPESGSGWTEYNINRGPNQNVWMTQVFIDSNSKYGEYLTPICITGEDGTSAGTDQADREYIYARTKGKRPNTPERHDGDNEDGYIPPQDQETGAKWHDNPQGIGYDSENNLWTDEWMCIRTKKTDDTWNDWAGPILWSHYGDNGTDGDGVEYIFAVSQTKQAPADNPQKWYDNAASKADTKHESFNKDEYIKEESKGTWTDDPQEVPQGGTAWVSVRKKRNDHNPDSSETEDAYWHQYSNPTLWAYHAKDGVSDAITADVTGETRYLYLKDDNTNKAYSGEAGLHLYNSGAEISYNHEFESFKCSDASTTVSDWNGWFNCTNKVIKMTIPEGGLNMADGKYWTLRVKLTPTDTAIQSNVRYVDIQFYGIVNGSGTDAVSYRLDTNASAINYQDGSLYPSMISCYITKSDGNKVTQIYPNETSDWTFSYSTNGGTDWQTISQKEIQTAGEDGMYFRAQNGNLDFKEYVPIIKAPAVDGINGVTYKIEVSDMSLNYKANEGNKYNISSTFTVKLYKKEGNADYTLQETAGYNCNVSTNPSVEVTPPTKSDNQWACSISGEVSSSSATIQIIINNSNGAFVDSITIPISAAGKDGGAGTGQTFKGSPLRILDSWESGKKYYDGKRDAENGVFYQDVVLYNNMYYACINTEAGESDQWKNAPDAASYWKVFAVTENFVADKIIANQAYIKELSSNEIVIFDEGTIVAGMTSSKDVDSKSDLNKKVTNKGNVRIWAGGMQREGDLTSAPFTVTDAGVLKCQAASGNSITLKDGTIYFVVKGTTYHLGITNGKPDWINSDAADRTETWYKKNASDKNISFTQLGEFAIKDNKYYTDATMKVAVSGTYYKKVAVSSILYQVGIYTYLTYASTFGVEIYNKASFVNGTKTMQGTVAITGSASVDTIPSPSPSGEISGTLNVLTTNKTWAKISKVDKPTGTFTYYVTDMIGSTSDSVKYTGVNSDNITFYNNTTTGIYVMSASDTEGSNLYTNLSGWLITRDSEINTTKYEIRNYDLNQNFKP